MMIIRGKRDMSNKIRHEDNPLLFPTDYYLGLIGRVLGASGATPVSFPSTVTINRQAVRSKGGTIKT